MDFHLWFLCTVPKLACRGITNDLFILRLPSINLRCQISFNGKGSERQKSECQKSKSWSKIWKGSERQKSFFKLIRMSKMKWLIRTSKMKWLIRTSKIRTSKRKSKVKNDFRRSDLFWPHRYYQNVKSFGSFSTQKHFWRSDFTYGVRKDQNVENQKDQLPMVYYLRVGSIRLG